MTTRLLATLAALRAASAFAPDLVLPHHAPTHCACAAWSANASSGAMWSSSKALYAAGASCALPANAVTPDERLPEYSPADGWCFCDRQKNSSAPWYSWCTPPGAVPTQINLLAVNASAVVVNFVMADGGSSARRGGGAEAQLRKAAGGAVRSISAGSFSTLYKDSESARHLSYQHVTLGRLEPRTLYEYRVRVGGANASEWSDWLAFRSLYDGSDGKPTRFALYADMGVFPKQNMADPNHPGSVVPAVSRHNIGNLAADVASGKIDFMVYVTLLLLVLMLLLVLTPARRHAGDHCYEFEVSGGARGDGYMGVLLCFSLFCSLLACLLFSLLASSLTRPSLLLQTRTKPCWRTRPGCPAGEITSTWSSTRETGSRTSRLG